MAGPPASPIRFADFELDIPHRVLRRGGRRIPLNARAFDVLVCLAVHAGRVVSKDELLETAWSGQVVEEANLKVQISAIRKALGESRDAPRFVTTVPGRGYAFVAEIHEPPSVSAHASIEPARASDLPATPPSFPAPDAPRETQWRTRASRIVLAGIALLSLATAGLAYWHTRPEAPLPGALRLERLTASGRVSAVTLTSDGKYTVYAQKEAGGESLWLRQIDSGSQTRIVPTREVQYLGLSVSPDGSFIFASVFLQNRADTPLWKIPILGGAPHEVPNVVTGAAVSFSPDGRHIAYTESHQPETHLKIAGADGANPRVLLRSEGSTRAFTFWQSNPVAWSPDGRTIAVAIAEKDDQGSRATILLVDVATADATIPTPLRWTHVENTAWVDNDHLAVIGDDDEWGGDVWIVSRRDGTTRRLTHDPHGYRWLSCGGGRLLAAQEQGVSTLHVAVLNGDARTARVKSVLSESGYIPNVAWSRQGDVLYSSAISGSPELWRLPAGGGDPTPVTADAGISFGLSVSPVDGAIVFASGAKGSHALWRIDAEGRNRRQITRGASDTFPDVSADGIIFQRGPSIWRTWWDDRPAIRLRDRGLKPVFSPDGRQIAFFLVDHGTWRVGIASSDTGALERTIELPIMVNDRRLQWHPSGASLTMLFNAGDAVRLLVLPLDGEPTIVEGLGSGSIHAFEWSADGRRLLYSLTASTSDAVLLSGWRTP